MNKLQLKKLIQEIALQEIRVVKNTPRFKVIAPDPIRTPDPTYPAGVIYISTSGNEIEGHFQRDDDFVAPFFPNPIIFGVMGSIETEIDESFLEMLQYLDRSGVKYNIQTYNDEDEVETYISVSYDNLKERNLIQK